MYDYRKMTPEEREEVLRQRRELGYPPHSPPRLLGQGSCLLLTAACYEHRHVMTSEERRTELLDELFDQFTAAGHEVRAWVVLPNHYHILVRLSTPDQLTRHFRLVHGRLSRHWNLEDGVQGRQLWRSFTDRAMRSERHYYTTLNYIHYNPVKHGHAASPYEWEASSVHWYRTHFGREWLRDLWCNYPVRMYGRGWDE